MPLDKDTLKIIVEAAEAATGTNIFSPDGKIFSSVIFIQELKKYL